MPFWCSLLFRLLHPLCLVLNSGTCATPKRKKRTNCWVCLGGLNPWMGVTLWLWTILQLNSWTQQKGNIDCNTIIRCYIVWDSNKPSISTCTSRAISDNAKRQPKKKKNIGIAILYKTYKQVFLFFK